MRKSIKREYELDRKYDYDDSYGFHNAKDNVGFVKRRARRRFRHNIIILCANTVERVIGIPTVITKGDYFYFILRDIEIVKNLNVKGEFI